MVALSLSQMQRVMHLALMAPQSALLALEKADMPEFSPEVVCEP